MMKKFMLSAASAAIPLLPLRHRHALAKRLLADPALAREYGFSYVSTLAQQLNVVRLSANGRYGVMSGSPNDYSIFKQYTETGQWAFDLSERLQAFFTGSSGGTYLDIGANIGMTTVPIAQHNPRVRCHAFEPEPINYQNLVRNILENCTGSNVATYQLALHEQNAVLPFELATVNSGDHRLHVETDLPAKQDEVGRKLINVPCARLDDVAIELSGRVFVKIDTQGAEPFVFAGGRETLARADVILFEWSPYHMARLGADPSVVLRFVESHFKRGQINETDAKAGQASESGPIDEITDRLRSTIAEWRNDAFSYVDVLVSKD